MSTAWRILTTVLIIVSLSYTTSDCTNGDGYDLPVRKIFVHGKPVLVRQIIEIESSNTYSFTHAGKSDANDLLSDNLQCFASAAERNSSYGSVVGDKDEVWARSKRHGFPLLISPLVPPAPAAAAPQVIQSPPQYIYVPGPPAPQLASQVVYVPGPPGPCIPPASPVSLPLPTPAIGHSARVAPVSAISSMTPSEQQGPNPNYPLPECYTDSSNFMCCHRGLENTLRETFHQTLVQGVNLCNVQKISNAIQNSIESAFNSNFEVVIGLSDFASKSHFYHNFICKVEEQGRYILAYASPKSEEELQNVNTDGAGDAAGPTGPTGANGESAGVSSGNDLHGAGVLGPQPHQSNAGGKFANVQQPQTGPIGQQQPPHYNASPPNGGPRRNHVYVWKK